MAQNEIAAAARAICEEKGISLDAVVETIESALAAAYRKDFGEKNQNIKVEFDLETGKSKVYDEKIVVEDMPEETEDTNELIDKSGEKIDPEKKIKNEEAVKPQTDNEQTDEEEDAVRRFNPRTEIQISEAKLIKKSCKIGDVIKTKLEVPDEYGRMAAQTAKQVIIQRLREIERTNTYEEYKNKEHEVLTGVVQRREGKIVIVDLGKTTGIIPPDGQVPSERYESGQRIKIYVSAVNTTAKGPEILLSRTSEEIVRKIFYAEIPEIANKLIEIKSVSREAGSRSKISVTATEENIDPIGSCVGQRGARIQTIISELGGEKVDIIEYSENATEYIANAPSPAKVLKVEIDEDHRQAVATVLSNQLSLAIGKGGQNVRLAAKLTGWKIDVREADNLNEEEPETDSTISESKQIENEQPTNEKDDAVVAPEIKNTKPNIDKKTKGKK